ncbi:MAG: ABC transporter substrate-binding protein [Geminicoccaceae bacterium]|nr:ABC transporter substrate-binding protein [Geminicoccaceae bacterium]
MTVSRVLVLSVGIFAALVHGGALAAEKIKIAALTLVSSAPLFIAQERGYYREEGLEAELVFFRAAQPVAVAVAAGEADFGVTAFTAGVFNLAGQGALKVIGAQSREEPGFDFSAYLASNAAFANGLTGPEKLPGKSLAITQHGSSFHIMAALLARKLGVETKTIRMVPLETLQNMQAALKTGQVDAAILPGHIATELDRAGEAELIGWVHQWTPYALGGLFTSPRNVERRRGVVEAFVRAYQKGARDYHAVMNKRDAGGKRIFEADAEPVIAIIAKYTQATPEAIKAGAPYIDPEGRLDVGSVYEQVALLKEEKLVDASVDPARFIDLSFISGHFNLPR